MSTTAYARALLNDLHVEATIPPAAVRHPAIAWAASGLMHVTGHPDGPGLMSPIPVTEAADGAIAALSAMLPAGKLAGLSGAALLGQRARLLGLRRAGAVSPGGACHLMQAKDGWLAISLAREEDWHCVPAWLQRDEDADWDGIATAVRHLTMQDLLTRARELGLAVARADAPASPTRWVTTANLGPRMATTPTPNGAPLVLDMSSLWAGPLCGALLARAGARVIKLESMTRPDGARRGHGGFFDVLNGGKQSVALDLRTRHGIGALRRLLAKADIVIESARPRALRQLGIHAEHEITARPGLTWVSITGHGRTAPQADWVGFGDDAAAAGGFAHAMHAAHGHMLFCGDALADPLTGLHAATAAWAAWRHGGGALVALSLSGVAAHCAAQAEAPDLTAKTRAWQAMAQRAAPDLLPLPRPLAPSRPLGADTSAVLAEAGAAC
jgi:hypothetical protein